MFKYERSTYIFVICLLCLLLFRSCAHFSELTGDYSSMIEQNRDIRVQHQSDSSKLYSLSVDYRTAIQNGDEAIAQLNVLKLKKPVEVVIIPYKTKIQTSVPLDSPIKIDSTLYLKLPQNFSKTDKWFSINGKIDIKGTLVIDSLSSFGTLTYGVGDTLRHGIFNRLLRKKDHVVRLHIDNPNMEIGNMRNIYVRENKKWYQTTGFKMLVGAAIGFGVATSAK